MALCDHCHRRPRYVDGLKTHAYCSKSCAAKSKISLPPQTSSVNGAINSLINCDFCHKKPKNIEGNRIHDFCSKTCARNARQKSARSGVGTNKAVCQAPGCWKPTYVDKDGECSNYCSISHKAFGATLCLLCLKAPKVSKSHFCSQQCKNFAEGGGPMILEVPFYHETFKSVAEQFKQSWRHINAVCPPLRHVYKIISPAYKLVKYNAYRDAVEARGKFVSLGRSKGNENRRWHGTRRACNLGDKGRTQLCSSSQCFLCSIIRNSFDISVCKKSTGWARFGKGIYTSSTSSKSNTYSYNDCQSSLKAALLNKVIVGNGFKLLTDAETLTAPPKGFDSVLGEKGEDLNHDELVVYTNDAIRPSYLVMYEP